MKKHLQKIGQKGWMLGKQLLIIGRKIMRQIILPGRNRKGNLLSSLLLLFIELTALFKFFPWEISTDAFKRWKHYNRFNYLIRKCILITGCFLFLLSSFEWSYAQESKESTAITYLDQKQDERGSFKNVFRYTATISLPPVCYHQPYHYTVYSRQFDDVQTASVSIYILHCHFRI